MQFVKLKKKKLVCFFKNKLLPYAHNKLYWML